MKTVEWRHGEFLFLDQTRLPLEETYVATRDVNVVAEAIRRLQIRGAPAIGVAAAFGAVLACPPGVPSEEQANAVRSAIVLLRSTRPTAVNLFAALDRMANVLQECASLPDLPLALEREALAIEREDVEACRAISRYGADLLLPGSSVLTHCNAGALATAGMGTALGVILEAHARGSIVRVYADETRPLLQGARLTAWELMHAGVETVLITDNTAGVVLSRGMVQAVVVGADRIAANGDTANKVGTYTVAVLAARHHVPFYVAAPTSTIDPSTPTGGAIVIEERDPAEVTTIQGVRIAAPGVGVFSPAFDVTPNELIAAIVTEHGVLTPPYTSAISRISHTTRNQGS